MKRDIKFRGISKEDNEFVFGYYARKGCTQETYTHVICVPTFDGTGTIPYFYLFDKEVLPESVDQFTGLYDKNQNEIYESDILKVVEPLLTMDGYVHHFCQVVFKVGTFCLKEGNSYYELGCFDINETEVVGTIYDKNTEKWK